MPLSGEVLSALNSIQLLIDDYEKLNTSAIHSSDNDGVQYSRKSSGDRASALSQLSRASHSSDASLPPTPASAEPLYETVVPEAYSTHTYETPHSPRRQRQTASYAEPQDSLNRARNATRNRSASVTWWTNNPEQRTRDVSYAETPLVDGPVYETIRRSRSMSDINITLSSMYSTLSAEHWQEHIVTPSTCATEMSILINTLDSSEFNFSTLGTYIALMPALRELENISASEQLSQFIHQKTNIRFEEILSKKTPIDQLLETSEKIIDDDMEKSQQTKIQQITDPVRQLLSCYLALGETNCSEEQIDRDTLFRALLPEDSSVTLKKLMDNVASFCYHNPHLPSTQAFLPILNHIFTLHEASRESEENDFRTGVQDDHPEAKPDKTTLLASFLLFRCAVSKLSANTTPDALKSIITTYSLLLSTDSKAIFEEDLVQKTDFPAYWDSLISLREQLKEHDQQSKEGERLNNAITDALRYTQTRIETLTRGLKTLNESDIDCINTNLMRELKPILDLPYQNILNLFKASFGEERANLKINIFANHYKTLLDKLAGFKNISNVVLFYETHIRLCQEKNHQEIEALSNLVKTLCREKGSAPEDFSNFEIEHKAWFDRIDNQSEDPYISRQDFNLLKQTVDACRLQANPHFPVTPVHQNGSPSSDCSNRKFSLSDLFGGRRKRASSGSLPSTPTLVIEPHLTATSDESRVGTLNEQILDCTSTTSSSSAGNNHNNEQSERDSTISTNSSSITLATTSM